MPGNNAIDTSNTRNTSNTSDTDLTDSGIFTWSGVTHAERVPQMDGCPPPRSRTSSDERRGVNAAGSPTSIRNGRMTA